MWLPIAVAVAGAHCTGQLGAPSKPAASAVGRAVGCRLLLTLSLSLLSPLNLSWRRCFLRNCAPARAAMCCPSPRVIIAPQVGAVRAGRVAGAHKDTATKRSTQQPLRRLRRQLVSRPTNILSSPRRPHHAQTNKLHTAMRDAKVKHGHLISSCN